MSKACRKPARTCRKPGCKPGRKPGLQLARIMECGLYCANCPWHCDAFRPRFHKTVCAYWSNIRFLPRDAMQARSLLSCSVCPSVTFVSCVKTNKDIFEIFSLSGGQAILVFPYQTGWRYSDRNPLTPLSKYKTYHDIFDISDIFQKWKFRISYRPIKIDVTRWCSI